ncbi:ABC transporter substrate-binding protein [Desulfovibrio sp. JC010]|uniref:substrate-binding periplasmic protein n=1 Tax=Desulfovibrio sp. JC010 TaxID=2593641 RepID=UPI0013D7E484|nr:transporter substrate-binding domain-containing protein [Desulfovibrio sp. JC010]NDV25249.1 amino acid ABC transporter substrate-binding protein [Desulfovibrio sp. JC010]
MLRTFSALCFAFMISFSVNAHAAEELIISGKNSTLIHACAEVLKEAYEEMGIEIEPKYYPILRAVKTANSGHVDGEIAKIEGMEKQYPNLIRVPVPIYYTEAVVLTKNTNIKVSGWKSLAPYRLGILRGVHVLEEGLKKGDCTKFATCKNNAHMLKMIEADRIQAGVISKVAAMEALKNSNSTDVIILEPPVETTPLYHYLNKKHAALIPQLTTVLEKMQKSGRMKEIKNSYLQKHFYPNH